MYGMKKTTLYLPDDLKTKVEKIAKQQKRSEATVIRDAIAAAVGAVEIPKPRPLEGVKLTEKNVAERVDELMEGFGEL
jgi:adenosylmethionine-8-amino-7-oxononanoate aminotransferase